MKQPVFIADASGKHEYARHLAGLAASRGSTNAHHALACVLTAASAAFARDPNRWRRAMEEAIILTALLPMTADPRVDVLTDEELSDLRLLIERLHAHIADEGDETPAQSMAKLRDIAAFDILILSQSLSRGDRTTYGPGGAEDVSDRLAAALARTLDGGLLEHPHAD